MSKRITTLAAALAVASLLVLAPLARAEQRLAPEWMKADPAAKRVDMDVVAGWNANNSSWNFNGYQAGDATVLVPLGWNVRINFTNRDGEVPHSLVVIDDPHDPSKLPERADRNDTAFRRAYSKSPIDGIGGQDKDSIVFKADKEGEFLWYCGVPGHGLGGMWIRFKVKDGIDRPALIVADGADPGRT